MFLLCCPFYIPGIVDYSEGNITSLDPAKIAVLVAKLAPRNVKEVRSFIGLCSYLRRHIEHFATIVEPLLHLMRKNAYFDWDSNCEAAFNTLKERITQAPVLKQPEFGKPFILCTDASSFAVGAVLEQEDDNGEIRRWPIIVDACHRPGEIIWPTNRSASLWLPLSNIFVRINLLSEFDCGIRHRSGKENVLADYHG